jgi:2,3-dihydroxy-p-cumate/2,3-dihydroxybenzoate 3,4-dioxygenase
VIRHMVVFRFRPEVPEPDRAALLGELETLPTQFASMRRFALGENISRRDDTFSHAFSVEFETEEELVEYLGSDQHERFVRERFRPLVEGRAIVSFVAQGEDSAGAAGSGPGREDVAGGGRR